jgi:hypothetical protein
MPKRELAERGGYTKVRTQRLPGGRYRHIFIVREPGPHGGKTVAGEVQKRKERPDTRPAYKMRPRGRSGHANK